MQDLPHRYAVSARAAAEGEVVVSSRGVGEIPTAAPAEFGGPGDRWSPETLLVAAVADCFVLSFRAIARASGFAWRDLDCKAEGVLDRVDGTLRFSDLHVRARLVVQEGTDEARARRLLEKAEKSCLVSNSLLARRHLALEVVKA
ncbi:MAG TPA: osmotically inducible protein OsmC [Deltaproteobacteria bacterium]|nr:osmotically inducible protein OsmC [Deltaproteobacteria bacterium]